MILTERDEKIYKFVAEFKAVRTNAILNIFFPSLVSCQNRLKKLCDNGILKRDRNGVYEEYVYYIRKKTPLLRHALTISDFAGLMAKYGEIEKYFVEKPLNDIRPDLVLSLRVKGELKIFVVEAEISNNVGSYKKYECFDWTEFFSVKPTIVYITRQKINDPNIVTIKPDFSDIEKLMQ